MITKSSEDESNTKYAQGGIAAVMHAPDTFEKHIQDTLNCGDGLCKEQIVRMVVEESTTCIEELIAMPERVDILNTGFCIIRMPQDLRLKGYCLKKLRHIGILPY